MGFEPLSSITLLARNVQRVQATKLPLKTHAVHKTILCFETSSPHPTPICGTTIALTIPLNVPQCFLGQ